MAAISDGWDLRLVSSTVYETVTFVYWAIRFVEGTVHTPLKDWLGKPHTDV